jgi:hypothetical protein
MHLKTRSRLAMTALLAGFPLCVCAAEFAPPAVGPVAFRRDQMPLAAWTMAGLSRHLDVIVRALPGETAAQRQAAARALALAIALDPANEEPRKLLELYQNGPRTPDADAARLAESQARIWQLIAWLETPEAGPQGQALAFCLQDVMAVADPKHPRAAELREAGEKGAWAGWVPDIQAYESGKVAVTQPPGPPAVKPEIVEKPPLGPEILLPKASVQTVFRQRIGTGQPARWAYAPAPLQMRVSRSQQDGDARFAISIGPEGMAESLMESARTIRRLLEKQHGELPARMSVQIFGNEFMRAAGEGKVPDVSAAAAVLASAAITGREPEGTIIGRVDESGTVKLPARFWDQLQALGKGHGGRVVLPAAAADWLPAFIAMENPGVFMEHEILLASDFRQLLELGVKSPQGVVPDAAAKFQEIRARAEGQELRTYLANRFVRQRLEDLVKAAPFHASAAMLLLQGSTNRPRLLSRPVLASELRRSIEPMAWISRPGYLDANSKEAGELSTIYKSCRMNVDKLERYVVKTDSDLWESSRETTAALWKLSRAVHSRGEYPVVQSEIQNAMSDFSRLYRDASEQLDRAANDEAR